MSVRLRVVAWHVGAAREKDEEWASTEHTPFVCLSLLLRYTPGLPRDTRNLVTETTLEVYCVYEDSSTRRGLA